MEDLVRSQGPDRRRAGRWLRRVVLICRPDLAVLELTLTTLFNRDLWLRPLSRSRGDRSGAARQGWRMGVYAMWFVVAAIAGATSVLVQLDSLSPRTSGESRRLAGTTVLVLGVLTPLLLATSWSSVHVSDVRADTPGPDVLFHRSGAAWTIVLVGVLSHPLSMLVGYSGSGLPGSFPFLGAYASCVSASDSDRNTRVVIGYADSYPEAIAMRRRARKRPRSARDRARRRTTPSSLRCRPAGRMTENAHRVIARQTLTPPCVECAE